MVIIGQRSSKRTFGGISYDHSVFLLNVETRYVVGETSIIMKSTTTMMMMLLEKMLLMMMMMMTIMGQWS